MLFELNLYGFSFFYICYDDEKQERKLNFIVFFYFGGKNKKIIEAAQRSLGLSF